MRLPLRVVRVMSMQWKAGLTEDELLKFYAHMDQEVC